MAFSPHNPPPTLPKARPCNGSAPLAAVGSALRKFAAAKIVSTDRFSSPPHASYRKETFLEKPKGHPVWIGEVRVSVSASKYRTPTDGERREVVERIGIMVEALRSAGWFVHAVDDTSFRVRSPGFKAWAQEHAEREIAEEKRSRQLKKERAAQRGMLELVRSHLGAGLVGLDRIGIDTLRLSYDDIVKTGLLDQAMKAKEAKS